MSASPPSQRSLPRRAKDGTGEASRHVVGSRPGVSLHRRDQPPARLLPQTFSAAEDDDADLEAGVPQQEESFSERKTGGFGLGMLIDSKLDPRDVHEEDEEGGDVSAMSLSVGSGLSLRGGESPLRTPDATLPRFQDRPSSVRSSSFLSPFQNTTPSTPSQTSLHSAHSIHTRQSSSVSQAPLEAVKTPSTLLPPAAEKHLPPPEPIKKPLKTIPPNHPLVLLLDMLAYTTHIYNLFFIPLTLAFSCDLHTPLIHALNYTGDLILISNYCLHGFYVQFADEWGFWTKEKEDIMKDFWRRRNGWVYVVCSLPWDGYWVWRGVREFWGCEYQEHLGEATLWTWWALTRCLRLIPMTHFLAAFFAFKIPKVPLPISRLIKNIIVLVIIVHVSACLFWFVSATQPNAQVHSWIISKSLDIMQPHIDFETGNEGIWTNVTDTRVFRRDESRVGVPLFSRYTASFVGAFKSLFVADRGTVPTVWENAFTVLETLVAGIIAASFFGNLGVIIKHMDKSAGEHKVVKKHKYNTTQMTSYMHEKSFPPDLQTRILTHDHHNFIRTLGMDEATIFEDVPKILQQDIANELYLGLVSSLPLFKGCDPAFLYSITRAVKPLTLMGGWYVFRKDDEANEMYFIREGVVEVCSADGNVVFVTLKSGGFFGEIALLENCRRTASVRAAIDTDLCFLSRTDFTEILDSYPLARQTIMQTVEERRAADRKRAEEAEEVKRIAAEKEAAKLREKELKEARSRWKKGRRWGVGGQSGFSVGMSSGHGTSSRMSIGSRMSGLQSAGSSATGKSFFKGLKTLSRQSSQLSQEKLSELLQNSTSSNFHLESQPQNPIHAGPHFTLPPTIDPILSSQDMLIEEAIKRPTSISRRPAAPPAQTTPEVFITPASPRQSLVAGDSMAGGDFQNIAEIDQQQKQQQQQSYRQRAISRGRSGRGSGIDITAEIIPEGGVEEEEEETEGDGTSTFERGTYSGSLLSVTPQRKALTAKRLTRRGSWDGGVSPPPVAVPAPLTAPKSAPVRRGGSWDGGMGSPVGGSGEEVVSVVGNTVKDDVERRIKEWEKKHGKVGGASRDLESGV
ncbi:Kinesin-like protein kif27 [Rhizophlyctis rosea]|uniref:Kinesin-like protein kif27 n=1 Tax=Rhizophlyctis rosea TaxID=64517 RepID=A0AAD5X0P4_9FUNG|nr:Kinesin-like protein kif27 [Rhizophlyctis rosea]